MIKRILIPCFLIFLMAGCNSPGDKKTDLRNDYPIHPIPFTQVKVDDQFWAPKIRTNHNVTIPIAFQKSKETGRIKNFQIAGGMEKGHFCSLYPFDDSDVYKNIEAASYSLMLFPDPALEQYLDSLISYIGAAQEDDGYLYTNRTINPDSTHEMAGKERWINEEQSSHELYNAGHMYEAAVAYFQATGKRNFLDIAIKNADLVCNTFGWGKLEKCPGHQEIEIGLVKLYRVTGEKKYLDQAKFFLDRRGPGGDPYNQMHEKPVLQREAVGHAVRAQYMYSAMADIAALTGDTAYLNAIDRLWDDVTAGKTYLTGGIGAAGDIEGFGPAYYLPNREAYCETCAAIANAFWNYRMFLLHGESKYFDVFEKVLYNGLISGVTIQGDSFFYPNPLESSGNYSRRAWFGCACCPVNVTRFLPSLPGYIYATKDDAIYVNLYIGDEGKIDLGGNEIRIEQVTNYPWDGKVSVKIDPAGSKKFDLRLRIPGWALGKAFPTDLYTFETLPLRAPTLMLNGRAIPLEMKDGYAVISRRWSPGDEVILELPMEIMKVKADPKVEADLGKVALQHGPLIYCAEQIDQGTEDLDNFMLDDHSPLVYDTIPGAPGGIRAMEGMESLESSVGRGKADFRAIPYYSWANRGKSAMKVWFPESADDTALLIIDIQDFYFPGGDAPLVKPEQAAKNAASILSYFRQNNLTVVHIRHNYEPGGDIYRDVRPIAGEKVISKDHANGFRDTDLLAYLRSRDIHTLVITGMQTHMCVEATTRAAADYGFNCIVISDACATRDLKYGDHVIKAEDVHYSTLSTLKGGYAQILTTTEFLKEK